MVEFSIEQRIFIVETYLLKKKSYEKCIYKFQRYYPESNVPSKLCVLRLFRKWRQTGSVLNRKKYPKRALTQQNLDDIHAKI